MGVTQFKEGTVFRSKTSGSAITTSLYDRPVLGVDYARSTLQVLSWNIANFNDHPNWTKRCTLIGAELNRLSPDIVCLQEVRTNSLTGQNALEDLLKLMDEPYYCLWQPIMTYKRIGGNLREGLAILSKMNPIETEFVEIPLFFEAGGDCNIRGAIIFTINLAENKLLFIVNTHLSYNSRQNISQVNFLHTILTERVRKAQEKNVDFCFILSGDMNSYGEELKIFEENSWKDMGRATKGSPNTFPASAPEFRPDKILLRQNGLYELVEVAVGCPSEGQKLLASDHDYVFTKLKLV